MEKRPFFVESVRQPKYRTSSSTFIYSNDSRRHVRQLSLNSDRKNIISDIIRRARQANLHVCIQSMAETMIGHPIDVDWYNKNIFPTIKLKNANNPCPVLILIPTAEEKEFIEANYEELDTAEEASDLSACGCSTCQKIISRVGERFREIAENYPNSKTVIGVFEAKIGPDISSKIYVILPVPMDADDIDAAVPLSITTH